MAKRRVIQDYTKIDTMIRSMVDQLMANEMEFKPVSFNDAKGNKVIAVPIETEDAVYMVKIPMNWNNSGASKAGSDDDDDDFDTSDKIDLETIDDTEAALEESSDDY